LEFLATFEQFLRVLAMETDFSSLIDGNLRIWCG